MASRPTPAPEYSGVVHSPPFTFLVGQDHTKLTIQSGLAKHVSPRLDELMNNGHTRESRHRIAVLEEEDVETFVGFCEFAYRGDYTVPYRLPLGAAGENLEGVPAVSPFPAANVPPPAPSPPATPRAQEGAQGSSANPDDGELAVVDGGEEGKESGEAGKKGKKGKKDKKPKKGLKILDEGAGASMTPPRTPPADKDDSQIQADSQQEGEWFDFPSKKSPEMAQADNQSRPPPPELYPPGVNLWDEFSTINYVQYHRQPAILPQHMEPQDAYILFHAKVYVFASRFLIPTLAQLALKKMHHDLISFSLSPTGEGDKPSNVPLVLEVLHYTYVNTRREDPAFAAPSPHENNAARENQLRKLLAHYAACRVRDLASYQPPLTDKRFDPSMLPEMVNLHSGLRGLPFSFRDLLDSVKELASDLVFRMM